MAMLPPTWQRFSMVSAPIAAIVELTFYRVNKWFVKKREISRQRLASNHTYSPFIERKIEAKKRKVRYHNVEPFDITNGKYEVTAGNGEGIERKGGSVTLLTFQTALVHVKRFGFSTIHIHTCSCTFCL